MRKTLRVKFQMFVRVSDFGKAHAELFPESSTGAVALAKLGQAISTITEHDRQKPLAAADGLRAKAAARAAMKKAMLAIARTARDVARKETSINHDLVMPRVGRDDALLQTARTFVELGQVNAEKLAALGLPHSRFTALREAADAFEAASHDRNNGREGAGVAQNAVDAAMAEAADAVRTLDVVVTNALEDNPVLLPAWRQVRRVEGAGKRGRGGDEVTETTADAVAPDPADTASSDPPTELRKVS